MDILRSLRAFVLFAAGTASLAAVPSHSRGIGMGAMIFGPRQIPSCGAWTSARAHPGDMVSAQYEMWVHGLLSGLNLAQVETRGDVLIQTDSQGALSWIDQYCRNHPLDAATVAVMALDKELERRLKAQ
jgi:hypothetical protein